MRKKPKTWYRLRIILLALVIVPPLGLFMLWRSPRSLRAKVAGSVAFLLFLAVGYTTVMETGIYARFTQTEDPAWGYDVSYDSRGRYRTPRILPLEREVFNGVVHEMRTLQAEYTISDEEITSIEMAQPEAKAFEIVAEQHEELTYDEVKAIYLKVSTLLVGRK